MYPNQLEFNFKIHVETCNENPKKENENVQKQSEQN